MVSPHTQGTRLGSLDFTEAGVYRQGSIIIVIKPVASVAQEGR